jgi:hypothetical protein
VIKASKREPKSLDSSLATPRVSDEKPRYIPISGIHAAPHPTTNGKITFYKSPEIPFRQDPLPYFTPIKTKKKIDEIMDDALGLYKNDDQPITPIKKSANAGNLPHFRRNSKNKRLCHQQEMRKRNNFL